MTPRFAVILIGCTLAGAAGAAYHRAASPPVASATVVPPLFMQAVAEAPLSGAWPPEQSVAFYQEMVALLTTAATVRTAAREAAVESPEPRDATTEPLQRRGAPAANSEPAPQRPTVAPPRGNDTIVIRDRFGRPIRVERVDRRRFMDPRMDPRAYPPHFDRRYGPYGAYAPPPWR
jgi:hypothetical protein